MKVYFYHTQNIQYCLRRMAEGEFPSHFLYGACHLADNGIDVVYHRSPKHELSRLKTALYTAWRVLTCREHYDALYATHYKGLELVVLLRALGLFRKPIIVWHHQPIVKSKSRLRELLGHFFYKGFDRLIFFSQKLVDDSLKAPKADPRKLVVGHWGADLAFYDKIKAELNSEQLSPSHPNDSQLSTLNSQPSSLTTKRPAPTERLFVSDAVEKKIREIKKRIKENAYLAWMFENCFPNTLDTTVHFTDAEDGKEDTFVYTGDIHAMWLRDSAAQVWPYVQLAKGDRKLQKMLRGVIRRQLKCINIDPYANAFNREPEPNGMWANDMTDMKPELHERKYEIDSLCYPIRLAYHYWQVTGDASVFGDEWLQAVRNILRVFREQQRKQGLGTYRFQRETEDQLDTVCNHGWGNPVKPCGLIASVFRPSDDASTFLFLVPSNFMAVSSLRKAAEILSKVNADTALAADCTALADEVSTALEQYAVVDHPKYGKIYAYEVDGFGNRFLMDDANVPSLLALPYLGDVDVNDPVYQNTRRFVWSDDNPYFFRGKAGEGIGGPHVGYDMAWPMSIMMRAFTSTDDAEIAECLRMLQRTDAGTGFIHESFNVDDANQFTREWFAWQNTLFGELIIKLVDEGKTELLVGARR